jgi:hypothetical protein
MQLSDPMQPSEPSPPSEQSLPGDPNQPMQPSRAPRPGSVTGAAIALIVLGVLFGLGGLLVTLLGALVGAAGEVPPELSDQLGSLSLNAIGGLAILVGLALTAFGAVSVASGIGALAGRSWARVAGMIAALLGTIFSLTGIFPVSDGAIAAGIVSLVLVATYAFSAWGLITSAGWFTRPASG